MSAIYFAYGSNMKVDRMTERVPSAHPVGYAKLAGNKLAFNKVSKDGSGKTNIVDSKNDVVFGVLFEVDEDQIANLDDIEQGYERKNIMVLGSNEQEIHVFTYISNQTNNDLKPYDWYLKFLVNGAEENNLPRDYVDFLKDFESVPDTRKKK
jgi:gamma-glutamylcyclotransferase